MNPQNVPQYDPYRPMYYPPVQPQELPASEKRLLVAFLLCTIVGWLGVHRFYAGHIGSGIAQLLLTLSGFGILVNIVWLTIDWFTLLCGEFRDADARKIKNWVKTSA